ncbi:DMT family transporter [Thalassospira marina]|uniref:EamA family transporter n=1 Tax=Thalassospira marina TaxID=2048283 RepID=A0A2N3KWT9_9PROT|nr:DMT family transporter [Thalassospira marina]PKR54960.1 EamA family transporter [Thalassospira marina]
MPPSSSTLTGNVPANDAAPSPDDATSAHAASAANSADTAKIAAAEAAQAKTARSALILVLLATCALAMKGLLAKFVYATGMTVDGLLLLRFLIAMPFFWFGVWMFGKNRPGERAMRPADMIWGGAFGGLFFAASLCDFTAVSIIDVTVSRIVLFSFPAIVMILEAVHRWRLPPPRQIICFLITYCGLILVVAPNGVSLVSDHVWQGVFWAFSSALTYACYLYFSQRKINVIGSMHFSALINTVAGIAMVLYELVVEKPLHLNLAGVLWTTGISIFCTVIPFFLLFEGIRRIGATQASLISLSGPALTFFAAWLLLGETLSPTQMAGFVVVIVGVASLKNKMTLAGLGRLLARPFQGPAA